MHILKTLVISSLSLMLIGITTACSQSSDSNDEMASTETLENASEQLDESVEEVKESWSEFSDSLKNYTAEQRESVQEKIQAELSKIDSEIDKMEKTIAESSDEFSDSVVEKREDLVRRLKNKKSGLEVQADLLRNSTDDAWEELKSGFNDAYVSLHESLEKARDEFDETDQKQS